MKLLRGDIIEFVERIFVPLMSAIIGGVLVSMVNIIYVKPREVQLEYKLNGYREFFIALEELIQCRNSKDIDLNKMRLIEKKYSYIRNVLFIYSSDEFLNTLIDFETRGLGINHDLQMDFDIELQKLVNQARKELKIKEGCNKHWENKFYFANFHSD